MQSPFTCSSECALESDKLLIVAVSLLFKNGVGRSWVSGFMEVGRLLLFSLGFSKFHEVLLRSFSIDCMIILNDAQLLVFVIALLRLSY